ncbi:MAG: DNA repair exonuclease [Candidatus Firestonebacteria bacterium]|nr:DNA repair exonuclease [Candidatus Firestonebacteria bacterium]
MKNTLKILHTADLHLGAAFSGLGAKGTRQRQRLREVLNDLVETAVKESAQVLLLAGDTFDNLRPSPESLQAFQSLVRKTASAGIPLVMIAGTHDHWAGNEWLPKLQKDLGEALVVLSPQSPVWEHAGLQVRIQGVSLIRQDEPEHPLTALRRSAEFTGWQIGMAHAALDLGKARTTEARFTPREVAATDLDYLALGHWHGCLDCSQGRVTAWFPGAPEMIALDETESGPVLLVQFEENRPVQVSPLRLGKRVWLRLQAEVSQVAQVLEQAKTQANPEAILDLTLTGLAGAEQALDVEALKTLVAPDFFHVSIHDRTQVICSPEEMDKYPETTALGRFIRTLKAQIESADAAHRPDLEKALQIGVAYLRGTEVRLWS